MRIGSSLIGLTLLGLLLVGTAGAGEEARLVESINLYRGEVRSCAAVQGNHSRHCRRWQPIAVWCWRYRGARICTGR